MSKIGEEFTRHVHQVRKMWTSEGKDPSQKIFNKGIITMMILTYIGMMVLAVGMIYTLFSGSNMLIYIGIAVLVVSASILHIIAFFGIIVWLIDHINSTNLYYRRPVSPIK